MRYPSNIPGPSGGFSPFPVNMRYPPPMPVSVSYLYDDGSWSEPQVC